MTTPGPRSPGLYQLGDVRNGARSLWQPLRAVTDAYALVAGYFALQPAGFPGNSVAPQQAGVVPGRVTEALMPLASGERRHYLAFARTRSGPLWQDAG
jgi:hypothetical protein